jgi:hypothetical protein
VNISCICSNEHGSTVFIGFENGRVLAWNPKADTVLSLREPGGERVINLAHATAAPRLAIATASKIECREPEGGSLIGQLEEAWHDHGFHNQAPLLVITSNGSKMFFGNPPRAGRLVIASRMLMENIAMSRYQLERESTIAIVAVNDRDY